MRLEQSKPRLLEINVPTLALLLPVLISAVL